MRDHLWRPDLAPPTFGCVGPRLTVILSLAGVRSERQNILEAPEPQSLYAPDPTAARSTPGALLAIFVVIACAVLLALVASSRDKLDGQTAVELLIGLAVAGAMACVLSTMRLSGRQSSSWLLISVGLLAWA